VGKRGEREGSEEEGKGEEETEQNRKGSKGDKANSMKTSKEAGWGWALRRACWRGGEEGRARARAKLSEDRGMIKKNKKGKTG
jgi:hypothetical protein